MNATMNDNQQARTGRWTHEEMQYLEAIVQNFRDGTLDIPNGTTLRSYIARELRCLVKRISKKMEGTAYNGRQSYERKLFDEAAMEQTKAQIRALKDRFEQSVVEQRLPETARVFRAPERPAVQAPLGHEYLIGMAALLNPQSSNVSGPLPVLQGGLGGTSAQRNGLAALLTPQSSNVSGPLPVLQGGLGGTSTQPALAQLMLAQRLQATSPLRTLMAALGPAPALDLAPAVSVSPLATGSLLNQLTTASLPSVFPHRTAVADTSTTLNLLALLTATNPSASSPRARPSVVPSEQPSAKRIRLT